MTRDKLGRYHYGTDQVFSAAGYPLGLLARNLDAMQQFNLPDSSTFYQAGQCEKCCKGYSSRIAVHETLSFKHSQAETNHQTLQQRALELISQGTTSIEEIRRVIDV